MLKNDDFCLLKLVTERLTLSFYQYYHVENPQILRDYLFLNWNEMNVLGRIYVAKEGINAQLSVPAPRFEDFKNFLDGISFLKGIRLNIAVEQDNESFLKLTVKKKLKKNCCRWVERWKLRSYPKGYTP